MTRTRHHLLFATSAITAAVILAGCSSGSELDESPGPTRTGPTATAVPTGAGPYPPPQSPRPAAPLPGGSSGTPRGTQPSLRPADRTDATAVSQTALQVMWHYDTRIDTTPHDASLRLADSGLCTDSYAKTLREHLPRAGGGADWNRWAAHQAYITVDLTRTEEAGRPQDTVSTAYRQWTGILTPRGRNGWRGSPTTRVAIVELRRDAAGDPWHTAAITLR